MAAHATINIVPCSTLNRSWSLSTQVERAREKTREGCYSNTSGFRIIQWGGLKVAGPVVPVLSPFISNWTFCFVQSIGSRPERNVKSLNVFLRFLTICCALRVCVCVWKKDSNDTISFCTYLVRTGRVYDIVFKFVTSTATTWINKSKVCHLYTTTFDLFVLVWKRMNRFWLKSPFEKPFLSVWSRRVSTTRLV